MEKDPLLRGFKPLSNPRIILGSFPTWTLTTPDKSKGETSYQKRRQREQNGDFPFFYGSARNLFWEWFQKYVDSTLDPKDIVSIKAALEQHDIGITNLIRAAVRKGRSSFDYDLSQRTYNYMFFKKPENNIKILCTSKTVLNEMLLKKGFFDIYQRLGLHYNTAEISTQQSLLYSIGANTVLRQPIYRCLKTKQGHSIECLAIPSPGSPFRGLAYFGQKKGQPTKEFLEAYLRMAFNWFISGS